MGKDDELEDNSHTFGFNLDDVTGPADKGFVYDAGSDQMYMPGERPHALLPHESISEIQAFINQPEVWNKWTKEGLPPEWEYLTERLQHKTPEEIQEELHREWALRVEEGQYQHGGFAPANRLSGLVSDEFQDLNRSEPMDLAWRLLKGVN